MRYNLSTPDRALRHASGRGERKLLSKRDCMIHIHTVIALTASNPGRQCAIQPQGKGHRQKKERHSE